MADGTARLGRAELTAVLQWRRLRRRILFSFPCREFLSRLNYCDTCLVRVVRCCAVPGNATGLVSRQSRTHVVVLDRRRRLVARWAQRGDRFGPAVEMLVLWAVGLRSAVLFTLVLVRDELAELQNCLQN
jgi:hypothetical protein